MYQLIDFEIRGVSPLKMHNGQLNDPLNKWSKALKVITSKKAKDRTDSDLEEMARLEWYGGIYVDESGHPVVPGVNIEGWLRDGGTRNKLGQKFQAGVICDGNWRVIYDGPKTIDALWKDGRFRDTVRAGLRGSGVMRTRPIFRKWGLKFTVMYEPDILNEEQVIQAANLAGSFVGLCDHTPKFGRSVVVSAVAKGDWKPQAEPIEELQTA